MGKLSPEQEAQLRELEAARDAPDPDDSDDISWYERGPDGERGATMRASRARSHGPDWLRKALTDEPPAADGGGQGDGGQGETPAAGGSASPTVRRFQRHASG